MTICDRCMMPAAVPCELPSNPYRARSAQPGGCETQEHDLCLDCRIKLVKLIETFVKRQIGQPATLKINALQMVLEHKVQCDDESCTVSTMQIGQLLEMACFELNEKERSICS